MSVTLSKAPDTDTISLANILAAMPKKYNAPLAHTYHRRSMNPRTRFLTTLGTPKQIKLIADRLEQHIIETCIAVIQETEDTA